MTRPAPGTPLCRLDDLDTPGTKGLTFGQGAGRFEMFLVRTDDALRAYVNECPHANQPLDSRPGRFLTQDEKSLICGGHAALFRIEDGLCTNGPCAGKSLQPVPVEVVDGVVRMAAK
ncbi:Rieske (2Fe-2S) domain protein [Parvibaculum lavamentivorans DS-1]|uniref:Rieske (2Fe-2S) domain protein n=1 Tax=Parvibaculum lavamentivorans (strain DS-1 / DSM 13023 / NCIMB 13966) TaxID=402881 RepID=A7HSS7_PARL1|nr:Rieske 2Fe-2S domain-containing protein [Parvibaculum lavamentivorans]ABS62960.1 Rieske (2Fe-2S) domain protein [Parvibaculum lavamentivorans DS-1]